MRQAIVNAGLRPKNVGFVSSTSRHWNARSGYAGLPSIITIDARWSSVETSAFHIIQAVVVNHWSRSPGCRSQLKPWFFRCSTRMPPWQCTIAFGNPVVPEEKRTQSGCAKGRGSNSSFAGSATSSSQESASGSASSAAAQVGHADDGLEARQPLPNRSHLLATVDVLLPVAVAGHGKEQLRLELAEPVQDAADAEFGWTRRPDRSQARGREKGDQRLGDVRKVGDDAVAWTDAEPLQTGSGARDLVAELAERELARLARLRVSDDGHLVEVLVATDHVLGVVQAGAREPLGARHLA